MLNFIKEIRNFSKILLLLGACYTQALLGDFYNPSDCCPSLCCPPANCGEGFITADFLYWTAYEGGLASCGISEIENFTNHGHVSSYFKSKMKDPQFQWSPGVRVGVGYQFEEDWFIAAYWTDFYTRASNRERHINKLHWKLNLEVVDLLFGYAFDVYSCFSFRPFAGVRGADIDQKVKGLVINKPINSKIETHNKDRFLGIGPLIGMEANWDLSCGFGVYADGAVSVLYGRHRSRFCSSDRFNRGANFSRLHQHLHARETALDLGFGFYWEKTFCNNIGLILGLGVEHHCYFNHNRIGGYGDLNLDGGTLSFALNW